MAIEQQIKITTDTRSLSALKTEIKEIQAQLDLTPSGTKEYNDLVVKLRQAKGEIKDFKEATKGLDPDQRAAKLVNAFQGMTGAIQAAAGAVTLFGGNSEDLEKVEKNLLGIIAIGGGIQSTIEGYNDAIDVIGPGLNKLGTGIKSAFTTATGAVNGFKVALASVGVGLLITGVTVLINKWDEWFPKAKSLNEQLGYTDKEIESLSMNVAKQTTEINLLVNAVLDQTNSEKQRRTALDELNKKYPTYFGNLVRDINDTESLIIQKNKLIDTLLREARVRAAQDKIAEIVAKNIPQRIALQNKLTVAENKYKAAKDETNKVLGTLNVKQKDFTLISADNLDAAAKEAGATDKLNLSLSNLSFAQGNLNQVKGQIIQLNKTEQQQTAVLTDLINTETDAIEANGGASSVTTQNTKDNTKAVKDNKDAIKERIDAYEMEIKVIESQRQKTISLYEDSIEQLSSAGLATLSQFRNITREQFQGVFALIADQFPNIKKLIIETTQAQNDFNKALAGGDKTEIDAAAQALKDQNKKILYERLNLIQQEQLAVDDANKKEIDASIKTFGVVSEETRAALDKRENDFNEFQKRKAQALENTAAAEIEIDNAVTQNAIDNTQKREEANISAAKTILDLNLKLYQELNNFQQQTAENQLEVELKNLDKRTKARIKAAGDDAEAVARIEQDAAEREDQIRKRAFENEKQRKIALAQINTAAAVISILAETPKGDFGVATAALIATALATSALQVEAIRRQEYVPSYAEGGLVNGLGTGQSDSILARLSNGEFVMNAKSTQRYLPVLTALNESGNSSINQRVDYGNNPPVFKTYVLAGDVTNAQIAEAKINQKRKL